MGQRQVGRWAALAACTVTATMSVVLDRISKDAAEALLANGPRNCIPGLLDFHLTYNRGAAWGLFEGARIYFIVMAALAVTVVLAYLVSQRQHPALIVVSLGLFVGGSLGNAIDRVLSGSVVDFLHLLFVDFPIFNIADSCITVGVCGLMLSFWLTSRQQRSAADGEENAPAPQDATDADL